MAVQKGRENWSTTLSAARLSGHRNFTEQIACLMRFASAEGGHKSNRLPETKNLSLQTLLRNLNRTILAAHTAHIFRTRR